MPRFSTIFEIFYSGAGRMLDVKVEGNRFHWPAAAGTKELLFTRLVCILILRPFRALNYVFDSLKSSNGS